MPITPILQFGTSRFLQAHVDLFVSEAMARGEALGAITVVQSTASAESAARVAAFNSGNGYLVQVRGRQDGQAVSRSVHCRAVQAAMAAETDWPRIRALIGDVRVIVSNTGDRGYVGDDRDTVDSLSTGASAPHGFPAKLLVLLHDGWRAQPHAPLSIFPCELISRNGDTLRDIVLALATQWSLPESFRDHLRARCVWANSLVDRIVSEPLRPAGAVAEPYALWAIEHQPGLVLPCTHPAIVLTGDLRSFERRKLFLLNLGHSYLAECWLLDGRAAGETVFQAMSDPDLHASLESLWADEVLPLFDALSQGREAAVYLDEVRDRLLNPFLAHRLADIAKDHEEKKRRRFAPVIDLAAELGLTALAQPRLRAALHASARARP